MPLLLADGVIDSAATKWTTLLDLKINPDEEAYITQIYIFMSDTMDGRQLRIISNGSTVLEYEPIEGFIYLMFWNPVLKFDGVKDRDPLVVQYKTDGTHLLSIEAQIMGIRKKKTQEEEKKHA